MRSLFVTAGTSAQQTQAYEINVAYQRNIAAIRADSNLSDEGKVSEMAAAYTSAAETLRGLQSQEQASDSARRTSLMREVFGIQGTPDPSAAISYRDAQDRAASLVNERDAVRLIEQADLSGDEHLARAAARSAYENGWGDALTAFAASRPQLASKLQELRELQPSIDRILGAGWSFAIVKPTELERYSDVTIARLARS
ncbi:hypothetical protein [Cellulomonas iranensis]|uniref:hypothetical protein n=1 Tax=Cellulomonas iranensis TaxID=76862 RepID=UPI003D7C3EAD